MDRKRKQFSLLIFLLSILTFVFTPNVSALEVVISGNNSGSNEVTVNQASDIQVTQTNELVIENNIDINANTGGNSVSGGTGGDSSISTGDVNSEVTIVNATNVSNVQIGCCDAATEAKIEGNGSSSQNGVFINNNTSKVITVNQSADVTNNVKGSANTGKNVSSNNTGGNVSIDTGDINVTDKVNNFSNLSSVKIVAGLSGMSAIVRDNAFKSENLIKANFEDNVDTYINHFSNIENYILWDANTGQNQIFGNTDGNVMVSTGDINIETFINNIINVGGVEIECCKDIFDPGNDDNGNGGNSDEDSNGNGDNKSGGSILPSAAATEAGGPGIIGLSDTSSQAAKALFFWISLIFIAIGGKIITDELPNKTSFKKIR